MKERLSNMIQSAVGGCAKNWADIIATHLLSKGVIVPPCKVGDTVYRVDKWNGWIIATSTAKSITPRLDHLNRYVFEILSTHTDVLGETVFLDREEAEEALAERSEKCSSQ